MTKTQSIAIDAKEKFLFNPTGRGRVYKGNVFGGSGIPSFIAQDAEGGDN